MASKIEQPMYNKYTKQLDIIWQNEVYKNDPFLQTYINRGYALPKIKQADLLFIGLNPAGREEKGDSFSYCIKQAVIDHPNFYGRYDEFAKQIGETWTFTDLFYFKETDSKLLDKFLKQPLKIQFLVDQLRITQQIIEEIKPKVIVVFNTKACMFFGLEQNHDTNQGIWMGYKENKDLYKQFGTPVLGSVESDLVKEMKHKIAPPIPIFFDSFISYQAKSSIKRLAWHIRYALKQIDVLDQCIHQPLL
jgi:hypothetical protein